MSSGEVKKVSREDIQLVQDLIERCLQLYMSQKEVINTLLEQAEIKPGFTELVWKKLEEENQEFFKAYHLRLMVKDQILQFNRLLEQQAELVQLYPPGMDSMPVTNGSHLAPLHQNSVYYAPGHTGPTLKAENINQSLSSCLHNTYSNGGPSLHSSLQSGMDMSGHGRRMDLPSNLLAHNSSNLGMLQCMNREMIKSESSYMGNMYMFYNDGNALEPRSSISDANVSSFSSIDSSSNPLNDALLDAVGGSVGMLGQIPRNFSLSDLTADFPNTSGILESYSRSAYVADTDLDHHGRDHQDPNRLCPARIQFL